VRIDGGRTFNSQVGKVDPPLPFTTAAHFFIERQI
jgi:hypothetical protein